MLLGTSKLQKQHKHSRWLYFLRLFENFKGLIAYIHNAIVLAFDLAPRTWLQEQIKKDPVKAIEQRSHIPCGCKLD